MNGAAALPQKMTLHLARHSQPDLPRRAVHIAPLERQLGNFKKFRDPLDITLGQVNKSLLSAAIRAARLAFKAQTFHAEATLLLARYFPIRSIAAIRFACEFAMLNLR